MLHIPFRATAVIALLVTLPCRAPGEEPAPNRVPVALYAGAGAFGNGPPMLLETLSAQRDLEVVPVTADWIRAGVLDHARVVIFPGGTAKTQALALDLDGRQRVRKFVADGGTYVGICAGCYLATYHYAWSLNFLPATVVDSFNWQRGTTTLELRLTPEGTRRLGPLGAAVKVRYNNGPVLAPLTDGRSQEKLVPLAVFAGELARDGARKGLMLDSPAIVAARFGKGWVIGISPHPEQTEGLRDLVPAAIRSTLGVAAEQAPARPATE